MINDNKKCDNLCESAEPAQEMTRDKQIAELNKGAPIMVQPAQKYQPKDFTKTNHSIVSVETPQPINVTELINELDAENKRLREALAEMVWEHDNYAPADRKMYCIAKQALENKET